MKNKNVSRMMKKFGLSNKNYTKTPKYNVWVFLF